MNNDIIEYFSYPIINMNEFTINSTNKNKIPSNTTHLIFDGRFNEKIEIGFFPENIVEITFGSDFNKSLKEGVLPKHLKKITFGYSFNKKILPRIIPESVTHITFGKSFNQKITQGDIPESVTHITFGENFNQKITQGVIPNGVTHLFFGNDFNQQLTQGDIPESVKFLSFGNYTQQFSTNVLPKNLVNLIIESQEITKELIPENLIYFNFEFLSLKIFNSKHIEKIESCVICYEKANIITTCNHQFCEDCITKFFQNYRIDFDDYPTCPICRNILGSDELFKINI